MFVTDHAKKRIKERLGINKKSMNRLAQLAIHNGVRIEESSGRLKKYLNYIYTSHYNSVNTRVFNQKTFIFNEDFTLITVIPLPQDLFSAVNKIIKRRRKNQIDNPVNQVD